MISRRAVLAGTVGLAAAAACTRLMPRATGLTPLEILQGPVTPMGTTPFDTLYVQQATKYAPGGSSGFPQYPGDLINSNYYDLALALYLLSARVVGDTKWRDGARTVAYAWARDPYAMATVSGAAPRGYQTLGLAIHYLDTADAQSKTVVNAQATSGIRYYGTFAGDMREAAYALMAMIAATIIGGDDHSSEARISLDSVLAAQKPDGRWENIDGCAVNQYPGCTPMVPAGYYTLNYMMGILMEALVMYDRAFGDSRIVPSLQKGVNWLWTTQWVATIAAASPAFGAFQYANINSGSVSTDPYANLSGLIVPAWGYLHAKTQAGGLASNGQTILDGMVTGAGQSGIAGAGIYDVKQFNQEFRYSPRHLGFVASSTPIPPTPPPAPTGLTVK